MVAYPPDVPDDPPAVPIPAAGRCDPQFHAVRLAWRIVLRPVPGGPGELSMIANGILLFPSELSTLVARWISATSAGWPGS